MKKVNLAPGDIQIGSQQILQEIRDSMNKSGIGREIKGVTR